MVNIESISAAVAIRPPQSIPEKEVTEPKQEVTPASEGQSTRSSYADYSKNEENPDATDKRQEEHAAERSSSKNSNYNITYEEDSSKSYIEVLEQDTGDVLYRIPAKLDNQARDDLEKKHGPIPRFVDEYA